jgi:hypothetical protein
MAMGATELEVFRLVHHSNAPAADPAKGCGNGKLLAPQVGTEWTLARMVGCG